MKRFWLAMASLALPMCMATGAAAESEDQTVPALKQGILCLIELPADDVGFAVDLCRDNELTVFFQTSDPDRAREAREAAAKAGLLGIRLFVESSDTRRIELGNNVADRVLIPSPVDGRPAQDEVLRVLRPRAIAMIGSEVLTKPVPDGTDDWSHPYHGPDNNPQSDDQLVRGTFRTQFIGYPMFSPMPEQSVIANGRIYKAMGHIAHKANQNEMLNTLLCINAFNGKVLWRRELSPGFMIHRNTMVATDDALYMGDHESCKVIDGETGEVRQEIRVDESITDGPVWKWMAMKHDVLYSLVGNPEAKIETQRAVRRGLGHWPWDMWDGHDYDDPRTSFGFGRTVVATDLKTGEEIWNYRSDEFLDARAICMNDTEIFCYCPGKFLAAIDRYTGKLLWKNSDSDLLDAIGDNEKAQHYITGYATTCYIKCTNDFVFFAGPQRARMVVASAQDGKLAWTHDTGNLQLVLREDGVWAAGPQKTENGMKFDYQSGKVLETFPARRACTRATGCADSIFFRANGGTVRVLTDSNTAQHIDPMRPPCQDGVLVAGGHLYWGPWMCGCQLSLYGNIGLRPSNGLVPSPNQPDKDIPQLIVGERSTPLPTLTPLEGDWATYRGGAARNDVSRVTIPGNIELKWSAEVCEGTLPTAPVTADGITFVADRSGAIQAFDQDGETLWKQYTGGPIYFAPTVANNRVFVGSADGRVYAFAAADGGFLWSYRVGPSAERIPVFDHLISAWPVSGGVAVKDGTVYAAAGITHYDGTYVVALDAESGELKSSNYDSGTLEEEVNNGISLQGELRIVDNELQFLAGGVYETARYDLDSLKCLNQPRKQVNSQFRTAFYPYYPSYGKYVSLDHQCGDGCSLSHDASYEGSQFVNLARLPALPADAPRPQKEAARWVRRGGKMPDPLWRDKANRRFTTFIVNDDVVIAGGHPDSQDDAPFMVAIDADTGDDIWIAPLPSIPVKGGASIAHDGQLLVTMENGRLLCFAPKQ